MIPLELPTITEEMRLALEEDLTLPEIQGAMNGLPRGKTSEGDGFPAEFYKTFTTRVSQPMMETFNEALDKGILPKSMREGHIVLILKKRTGGIGSFCLQTYYYH